MLLHLHTHSYTCFYTGIHTLIQASTLAYTLLYMLLYTRDTHSMYILCIRNSAYSYYLLNNTFLYTRDTHPIYIRCTHQWTCTSMYTPHTRRTWEGGARHTQRDLRICSKETRAHAPKRPTRISYAPKRPTHMLKETYTLTHASDDFGPAYTNFKRGLY